MEPINKVRDNILSLFKGDYQEFRFIAYNCNEINNPDESYLGTFNLIFEDTPDDDAKEELFYEEEQDFIDKTESYIKSIMENRDFTEVSIQNGHRIYYHADGDTLQIHWNDMSLMIITSFSGQY